MEGKEAYFKILKAQTIYCKFAGDYVKLNCVYQKKKQRRPIKSQTMGFRFFFRV